MTKTTNGMVVGLIGLAMLTVFTVSVPAAQRSGFETYVVRRGDTLSKISGRVFGDVKRWREILKENPQVTNANRIFPGDILLVPVPETAAPADRTGGGLAARTSAAAGSSDAGAGSLRTDIVTAPAATSDQRAGGGAGTIAKAAPAPAATVPELPVEQVRSIAVVSPTLYRDAGYIADNLPALAIIASQDERILLATGDAAIVNAPIPLGALFTVVRADRRIFHPVTGADLGWLIRILGVAEVTCRAERTATVALRAMNDAATIGDYLVPVDPSDVLVQNVLAAKAPPECLPAGACDGVIVAFNEDRLAVGEQELAYIDRGTAAGVTPGRRFTIYREIAPEGCITVGELQVLRAGANTATALITTSFQEVQVGHLLRAH